MPVQIKHDIWMCTFCLNKTKGMYMQDYTEKTEFKGVQEYILQNK